MSSNQSSFNAPLAVILWTGFSYSLSPSTSLPAVDSFPSFSRSINLGNLS
jgi:hypothetical protein